MDKLKVFKGIAVGGLLLAGTFGAVAVDNHISFNKQMDDVIAQAKLAEEVAFEKGAASVEPEVIVKNNTVEIIKEVNNTIEVATLDEDKAQMFCDRLLFDDVKECLEEVEAEDKALKAVLEFIDEEFNKDIADELEDRGIVEDEDEVDLIKVYDDFEDIEILNSDFDDEEYKFKIKLKIEDLESEDKKYVYATVKIEDNEIELVKVVE